MRFVTYNIQYGVGKDGRVDLTRIAEEIGDADVIALQEVTQFMGRGGNLDQVAELAALFPEHYWTYGPAMDADASYRDEAGKLVNRRTTFGNMILSKTAILSSRHHMLPKVRLLNQISLQRSIIEAVIETASGPLRVYSLHLAHASVEERLLQIDRLLEIVKQAPDEGGVVSAGPDTELWYSNGRFMPMPNRAVVMGDFNMDPSFSEYDRICGAKEHFVGRSLPAAGLIDAWVATGGAEDQGGTCFYDGRLYRLDYCFVTEELVPALHSLTVGDDALGSDHQPLYLEIEI
ncbi:endonuclease/exonuclease/phosphatase family protein [Kiloniella laminariae]|uniref:endonuclease/exonuclease/phosphatase family protein n=1 Tax=Kiloniella laminariae TaxID=454162 RepID=UPI000365E2CB|nr:endonuclease/exonuclease/phosphatase family protein [Kiloniella laminariae]